MKFKNKFLFSVTFLCSIATLSFTSCEKKTSSGGGPVVITPPPPTPTPTPVWDTNAVRGMWVTTTASNALDSRANIKTMVATCKNAGINNIFVVMYNNGRTMFPSTTMQNLLGVNILERFAGRDPLQECIEEAKLQRIKVHAWFEYGFASSYAASGGAIVAAKPAWAAKDVTGALVVKNSFDWLNPIHPEVQQFMTNLYKEVVTRYDVDGVQGDDRMPAMPTSGGYDTYTVNLYKSENGGSNPPNNALDAGWITWRAKKLNAYLKSLRSQVKAIKPNVQFSVSPSAFPWGLQEYLQDWPTWVDSGYVDAIYPQCYRYDIAGYNATIAQQKGYYKNPAVAFYPGVLLKVGTYVPTAEYLTQMIQTNRNNGFKGECFFFYEGIKDISAWFTSKYPTIQ